MIVSFADDETRVVFDGNRSRKLPADIQSNASRKLGYVNAANLIFDLRQPPSNHLERLEGNRKDQWSIRINDQWRICFNWVERQPVQGNVPQPGDAYDVEITNHYS
jgi:proteic killer suppression protein